jgi:hypothetical protein
MKQFLVKCYLVLAIPFGNQTRFLGHRCIQLVSLQLISSQQGAFDERDCFWLTKDRFAVLKPLLPNDTRGKPRVDDQRVISGIIQGLAPDFCSKPPIRASAVHKVRRDFCQLAPGAKFKWESTPGV